MIFPASLPSLILIYTVFQAEARTLLPDSPNEPNEKPKRPIDVIKPPISPSQQLDLAFVMDTTGSMSSYIESARQNIREIVEEITSNNHANNDIRLALIEYRDHHPQETTFVTRKHDFTSSVSTMKSWLNKANARGGGDGPEAVAEALFQTTTLSWRPEAAKISVLISDAPPHGLVPSEDSSFPEGHPNGHDPMKIVRDLAQKGVTLYVIGCEPAIVPYKDFFMALAYIAGGQYVPLSVPRLLVNAITGGAKEELSLQKFEKDVQQEIQKAVASEGTVNKQQIASSLFKKLSTSGAKSTKLVKNNKALEGPTANAKLLAKSKSMADVRKLFKKGASPRSKFSMPSFRPSFEGKRFFGKMRASSSGMLSKASSVFGPEISSVGRTGLFTDSVSAGSSSSDKLSTVESTISLEQVKRLVEKGSSKFASL